MLFNSIAYALFFPLVLLAYWLSPAKLKRPLLLVASYVFYMSWIPVYGILIFALTAINYVCALLIDKFRSQARVLLVLALLVNLGTLCFYKYTNFLIGSLQNVLQMFHLPPDLIAATPQSLDIILPLGISFFAFEFIHYIIEVYRGGQPIKNPVDFGLFAAFFPSQIAGPIKRYQDFIAQLGKSVHFTKPLFHEGLVLVLQGLFKKAALADNLAVIATSAFSQVSSSGTHDVWLGVIAFAAQIYFDFSGYTDMGRGSAMMLGFSLPDNFNLPYLATSITDFWKRWHISLSTWLRDYLYIPLGGGRCDTLTKYRNLMITMLLGGLWHGAAWHFVAWGGLHGGALVANHAYNSAAEKSPLLTRLHTTLPIKILCSAMTLMTVLFGWVFFRADTMHEALQIIYKMFVWHPSSTAIVDFARSPVLVPAVAYSIYSVLFACRHRWQLSNRWPKLSALTESIQLGLPARVVIYAGVFVAAIAFIPSAPSAFIYFQF